LLTSSLKVLNFTRLTEPYTERRVAQGINAATQPKRCGPINAVSTANCDTSPYKSAERGGK